MSSLRALVFVALLAALSCAHGQPLDAAFNPSANADVFALAAQPDGKILVGGNFSTLAGIPRAALARLLPDGSVDSTFNPASGTSVRAFALQPDGKILVGGSFTTIAGATRVRLARLNSDGSLDAGFNAGADASIMALALQPDGKILVGGLFAFVNNTARNFLARLNSDGSLDAAFDPALAGTAAGTQSNVNAIALQSGGKILAAGNFGTAGGVASSGLVRLNVDGSRDASFAIGTGANSNVQSVVQPDGKILIGGNFTTFAGQPRRSLARLSPLGVLDTVGTTGPSAGINAIVLLPNGAFVVAGTFNAVGSLARNRLARFAADGSFDPTYDPDVTGAFGHSTPGIYAMVSPGPDQLVIGGTFATVSGQPRSASRASARPCR